MTKRNQASVKQAREAKKSNTGRVITQKHLEQREEQINTRPLVPMNDKQREYIRSIENHGMTIATGFAGTSKTYIPTVMACDAYLRGEINKIVFVRPNVSNSVSLGMFKGSATEKMEMWLMPVINILRDRLGQGALECALERGNIIYLPLEVVKGFSAENCFFIVDEGEDISRDEAIKLVTRPGKNCKMVISGDIGQSELKDASGLKLIKEMAEKYSTLNVGFVDFNNINDIVRGEDTKQWIIALRKEGLQ